MQMQIPDLLFLKIHSLDSMDQPIISSLFIGPLWGIWSIYWSDVMSLWVNLQVAWSSLVKKKKSWINCAVLKATGSKAWGKKVAAYHPDNSVHLLYCAIWAHAVMQGPLMYIVHIKHLKYIYFQINTKKSFRLAQLISSSHAAKVWAPLVVILLLTCHACNLPRVLFLFWFVFLGGGRRQPQNGAMLWIPNLRATRQVW